MREVGVSDEEEEEEEEDGGGGLGWEVGDQTQDRDGRVEGLLMIDVIRTHVLASNLVSGAYLKIIIDLAFLCNILLPEVLCNLFRLCWNCHSSLGRLFVPFSFE